MPTCEDAARDPEQYCPSMPWCPACSTCLPGGGGIWRPALAYSARPLMLADHGEFAAWTSAEIIAATVVAIHDGNVDIQITKKDGSHWIERGIRVARYPWEWDAYLLKRAKWREFYLPTLKSAYEEFGHDPLPLLYYNGHVYLPNGPVQPFARIVMDTPDTVNVFAAFSDQLGESFFKGVKKCDIDDLDIWTLRRSKWLPILAKWTAVAQSQMVEYAGPNYLDYV